ncbi:glycoside hydrolase family 2 [Enterococcus sp. JM4C]|uniref:glycoside hydrolase family 2 protein n=1 Tax=Candidatus Enterococcus huntleyi TaxID=1857217 RepID=UPI001379560B|nr:sugar-binding domain-containing protein [Enterococcus sp. JM4C]KAF1295125.1 glycoside hydrolase family 2 [Enterococcus sp. JM4C]
MYREEYPRPQFKRNDWVNLNGTWQFSFDDQQVGKQEGWYLQPFNLSDVIEVPFVFQSKASGIEDTGFHDVVWYKRDFEIPKDWKDKKIILHFGAVDYQTSLYVNGQFVGEHIGGHTSFSFDITQYVTFQEDQITLCVFDPSKDERIPRGKQYWHEQSAAIWYTRTTGIWQTVWLEPLCNDVSLDNVFFTSDLDNGSIQIAYDFSGNIQGKTLKTVISYGDKVLIESDQKIHDSAVKNSFYLFNHEADRSDFHGSGWTWTPDTPNLYDVKIEVLNENHHILDSVDTYFGLRKIHVQDGMVHLNNRPFYQKLILDQGYWPETLMTAKTDEDFIRDIELAKKMGFNGCRKHQKVEDPRFLYWADRLGFVVWGECASPSVFSRLGVERLTVEWMEIISRDYNHPSILTWVPINESWGVPEISFSRQQQHFSQSIYHLIHSLDTTRLVISNDGWEMTETDICAVHSYVHGNKEEKEKYHHFVESLRTRENVLGSEPNRRKIYCPGFIDNGAPILLTEFGGVSYTKEKEGWGYTNVSSQEEFLADYRRIMEAVYASEVLNGFCYTQLTDVEQEQNGLLTAEREPKCSIGALKEINDLWHPDTINKRGEKL